MKTIDPSHQPIERLMIILRLPKWLFTISFAFGTLFLLLQIYKDEQAHLLLGFFFVMTALFVNTIVFVTLVLCSFIFKEQQKEILERAAILLINIPVAILYMYLVFSGILNEPRF